MVILGKTKTEILRQLKKQETHGYRLAEKVNIPVTGIYQQLNELCEDGLVSFERSGRRKVYYLTKKGERLLEIILSEPKE